MKAMKRFIIGLFGVLAAVIPIAAQELPKMTIVTEEFAPFNYTDNGKITGISTEVVEAIFHKAGLPSAITVYPWARAYDMATKQPNVVIYSISMRDDRLPLFKEWIGPIAEDSPVYFCKLKNRTDIKIQSLDEAKAYKIGVIKDWSGHQFLLKKGFSENKIDPVVGNDLNFKKLTANRIDLVMANDKIIQQFAEKPDQIEKAFQVLGELKFYMAVSKDTPDGVIQKLKAAFEAVKAEGKIQAINAKYLK